LGVSWGLFLSQGGGFAGNGSIFQGKGGCFLWQGGRYVENGLIFQRKVKIAFCSKGKARYREKPQSVTGYFLPGAAKNNGVPPCSQTGKRRWGKNGTRQKSRLGRMD
jgi:hypothetical protein